MIKVKNSSRCLVSCIIEKAVSLESICLLVLSWLFVGGGEMRQMIRNVFEGRRSS